MRAFEFLKESKDPVSSIVKNLEIVSKKTDENPELLDTVEPALDELEQKVADLEAKAKQPAQQSPIGEDQATDLRIQNLEKRIANLRNKLPPNDPDLLAMEDELVNLIVEIDEAEKAQSAQGFNLGKSLTADTKQERLKKAKSLAERLGKQASWANNLIGALSLYEDQLENDFLDLCLAGQGLTQNITAIDGLKKFNLKTAINPKLSGIFDNKEAFDALLYLPFAEQKAGFGGGVGPGEALLAMLIPNAKRASPGDISVNNETWELKSGSYSSPSKGSSAWLDSSPNKLTGPALRKVFDTSVASFINPLLQKSVTVGDTRLRVSQALELADFRSKSFSYLKAVFSVFDDRQRAEVIDKLYSELYPSVKNKKSDIYNDIVAKSILAINAGDHQTLAKSQAKGGMMEYALGNYNSPNFIIYNSTTHDILSVKGEEGIFSSLESNDILATTVTMGKSPKASAGVFLQTSDYEFLDKAFRFDRKRKRTARSKTF
jgi:polyhydroxyalkanoate synthesis regulator phasin